MSDHDALLAAVYAAPADDLPRLVYADWLEEHDGPEDCPCEPSRYARLLSYAALEADDVPVTDLSQVPAYVHGVTCPGGCDGTGRVPNHYAARAELIRVQCELAAGTRSRTGPAEARLLGAHWDEWLPPALRGIGCHCGNLDTKLDQHIAPAAWFHRGFVTRVRVQLAEYATLAGLGPALALVEHACPSDAGPLVTGNEVSGRTYSWWDAHDGWSDTTGDLPHELFERLWAAHPSRCRGGIVGRRAVFDREEDAYDALSGVILAECWELAAGRVM